MSRRSGSLGGVNIHGTGAESKPPRSGNPNRLADMRAAANLVKDLRSIRVPLAVARSEAKRVKYLATALAAGRITLDDARAQLRGAA